MPLDPVSPWPALAAFVLVFALMAGLARLLPAPQENSRYASIDGLRGYLAFGVFLHHASIWYFYLPAGVWKVPPSALYTHLGQSSVMLFFMITGFLFFGKLLAARAGAPLDWLRLAVGRLLRLLPLYLLMVAALLLVVAVVSDWRLQQPPLALLKAVLRWLAFTVEGAPDVNGLLGTSRIVAGVTWSLPYEWFFYLSLPGLALLVLPRGRWPGAAVLLVGALGLAAMLYLWQPLAEFLAAFLGGMLAAVLLRWPPLPRFAASPAASALALGLLLALVLGFEQGRGPAQTTLLSAFFCLVAAGTNLFGLLSHRASRALGELAYGIYLLHGLLLFVCFKLLLGQDLALHLSPLQFWLLVLGLVPALLGLGLASFSTIERPAMARVDALTAWLRARRRTAI